MTRFHGLRHQVATSQFATGARQTEVGAFLPHAPGSKMTARYTHLFAPGTRAAAARVDAYSRRAPPKGPSRD